VETPALLHNFAVVVDVDAGGRTDLGAFASCSGLKVSYAYEPLVEGGENNFAHRLWGPAAYGDVTLARGIDGASAAVAEWVNGFATDPTPTTARIAALDPAGEEITAWSLQGVVPLSWTGPQWKVDGASGAATETLVIAHTGFMSEGSGFEATFELSAGAGFSASAGVSADVSASASLGGGFSI
jgi:phage tail-like protein